MNVKLNQEQVAAMLMQEQEAGNWLHAMQLVANEARRCQDEHYYGPCWLLEGGRGKIAWAWNPQGEGCWIAYDYEADSSWLNERVDQADQHVRTIKPTVRWSNGLWRVITPQGKEIANGVRIMTVIETAGLSVTDVTIERILA